MEKLRQILASVLLAFFVFLCGFYVSNLHAADASCPEPRHYKLDYQGSHYTCGCYKDNCQVNGQWTPHLEPICHGGKIFVRDYHGMDIPGNPYGRCLKRSHPDAQNYGDNNNNSGEDNEHGDNDSED
jgi:hypothetical protein